MKTTDQEKYQALLKKISTRNSQKKVPYYKRISKIDKLAEKKWKKNKRKLQNFTAKKLIYKESSPSYQQSFFSSQASFRIKNQSQVKKALVSELIPEESYKIFDEEFRIYSQPKKNKKLVKLLECLNLLSTSPGLVLRLFEIKDINMERVYTVWINFNGKWEQFLLDEYFPVIKNNSKIGEFIDIDSNTPSIWHLFLAKAIARAYGGYHRIQSNSEADMIKDFTGFEAEKVSFNDFEGDPKKLEKVWGIVEENIRKGRLISAKCVSKQYARDLGMNSQGTFAIVTCCYAKNEKSKIDRLIKLRTCFKNFKWKGEWGPDSENWNRKNIKMLGFDKNDNLQFWVKLEEFCKNFEAMKVYFNNSNQVFTSFKVNTDKKKFSKKLIRLSVRADGDYTLTLSKSHLEKGIFCSQVKFLLISLKRDELSVVNQSKNPDDKNVHLSANLRQGEYLVLLEKKNSKEYTKSRYINNNNLCLNISGAGHCEALDVNDHEDSNINLSKEGLYSEILYLAMKDLSRSYPYNRSSELAIEVSPSKKIKITLKKVEIPNFIVYCLKSENFDKTISISAKVQSEDSHDVMGPWGDHSKTQKFKIYPGEIDLFILNESESKFHKRKIEESHNFKIKIAKSEIVDETYSSYLDKKNNLIQCLLELFKPNQQRKLKMKFRRRANCKSNDISRKVTPSKIPPAKPKIQFVLPTPPKKLRLIKKARFNPRIQVLGGNQVNRPTIKAEKPNSILASKNKNLKTEMRNVRLFDAINLEVEAVDSINEDVVARVMVLRPEELLTIPTLELKHLIKYFGLHSFIYIYQVEYEYLTKVYKKVAGVEYMEEKEKSITGFEKRVRMTSVEADSETASQVSRTNSTSRKFKKMSDIKQMIKNCKMNRITTPNYKRKGKQLSNLRTNRLNESKFLVTLTF